MQTMEQMTLQNIARACGGALHCNPGDATKEITCGVIDSRKLEEGGLFFAAKGERVDGHKFIGQVFEKGALCVVTEKTPEEVKAEHGVEESVWGAYILVEDTFAALQKIAAFYRSLLKISVVGITGSVGKTSTKEYIAGVLSVKYKVLKTEGNFNNEVGLPLTLLRIRREHEVAVVEMGISDFGEMSRLGAMARPDICVITNIGQSHLNNLHDRAGIFKAKTEMFDYLQPGGEVCLNGEDDMLAMVSVVNGRPVHHFGISENEDFEVYAGELENLGLMGSRAMMHMRGVGEYPVEISQPGNHMVINAMAAALVGKLLGLTPQEITEGVREVKPLGGRSNILKLTHRTVIDDCYNANPVSMRAAIDLLASAEGRKVAILGDMFNLGDNSDAMHAGVGKYAVDQGIDAVFCVGENARFIYDAALEAYNGMQDVRYFVDNAELLETLDDLLEDGDTILVKASHDMEFGQIIEWLKKEEA